MLDLPTEASPSRTSLKPFRGIRAAASPYDMASAAMSAVVGVGKVPPSDVGWFKYAWYATLQGQKPAFTKHESKGGFKVSKDVCAGVC